MDGLDVAGASMEHRSRFSARHDLLLEVAIQHGPMTTWNTAGMPM